MKRFLAVLMAASLIAVSGLAQAKNSDERRHEKQAYHQKDHQKERQNHHRRQQERYEHKNHHRKDDRRAYTTKKYGHRYSDRYVERGVHYSRHQQYLNRFAFFQPRYRQNHHNDNRYGQSARHRHDNHSGHERRLYRKYSEQRHDGYRHKRTNRDDRISYFVGGAVVGSVIAGHLNNQYDF